MNACKTYDEQIVGVLIDVMEAYPEISYETLVDEGFSDDFIFTIKYLSKTPAVIAYTEIIKQTGTVILNPFGEISAAIEGFVKFLVV